MKFFGYSFETINDLKNLIEVGKICVNYRDYMNDQNIYQYCCGHGTPEMLEYLDSLGKFDVNQIFDSKDWNCYLTAAYWGKPENMKYLEQVHHININFLSMSGSNAYILAASNGHLNVLYYLDYVHKVDREFKNKYGRTAFYYAKMHGYREVVDYLTSDERKVSSLIENIKIAISVYESEDKKRIKKLEDTIEKMSDRILHLKSHFDSIKNFVH